MTDDEKKLAAEREQKRFELSISNIENRPKVAIQANIAVPCDYVRHEIPVSLLEDRL